MRVELGMVQVLGRLAVSCGILAVAGLSGLLANMMPRQNVFLLGLSSRRSRSSACSCASGDRERRAIDWRILGGGIVFGAR